MEQANNICSYISWIDKLSIQPIVTSSFDDVAVYFWQISSVLPVCGRVGWLVGWIGAEQGRVTLGRWSSPDQPRAGILSQEQAAKIKRLVVHKKWEIPGSCLRYSLIRWPLKKLATQQKRHCCNLDMGTLRKLFLVLDLLFMIGIDLPALSIFQLEKSGRICWSAAAERP